MYQMELKEQEPSPSVKKLKAIWDRKLYRIFPVAVTKQFRRNRQLTSDAVLIWQMLFEQAYFDENWSVKISCQKIAEELGISGRTVTRALLALSEQDYLKVTRQSGHVSIYFVRLPDDVVDHILQYVPDRKSATVKLTLEKKGTATHQPPPTQICQGGHDKFTHHTLYNININNNNKGDQESVIENPPVVVNDENVLLEKKIEQVKKTVESLDHEIAEASLSLPKIELAEKMTVMSQIKELDTQRFILNQKIASALQKIDAEKKQQGKALFWQSHPDQIYRQSGERKISELHYHQIRKRLTSLGFSADELNKLTNELIYEIRFGSLTTCRDNQKPMHTEHAINVGIKLLREKRWKVPVGMEKFNQQNVGSG